MKAAAAPLLQVRTLSQQRDAAQANIKTLAAQLLDAQKQMEANYKENKDKPPAATQQQQAATPEPSAAVLGRQEVWRPSAERERASKNPELVALLKKVAINDEVAVAISNKNLAADNYMLHAWCQWMQRAGANTVSLHSASPDACVATEARLVPVVRSSASRWTSRSSCPKQA